MALIDELRDKISAIATESWDDITQGRVVPTTTSLTFSNSGISLDACILYADIHGSTRMVDLISATLAAEYYKSFLYCGARLIKSEGGDLVAYDGDRVMAVFLGEDKVDCAIRAAFKIKYAVDQIINPEFSSIYGNKHFELRHTVGIDAGTVLVAKTGIRADNDLVWVGPAANYAAKLNSFDGLDIAYSTRITVDAYKLITDPGLISSGIVGFWNGPYKNIGARNHYRSNFHLAFT
jgi:class 3 adenylate cyclase